MTRIPTPEPRPVRSPGPPAARAPGPCPSWSPVWPSRPPAPHRDEPPVLPSDGLRVDLTSELRGLNLLVVTAEDGEPGALVGAFANDSTEDVEFDVTPEGGAP